MGKVTINARESIMKHITKVWEQGENRKEMRQEKREEKVNKLIVSMYYMNVKHGVLLGLW